MLTLETGLQIPAHVSFTFVDEDAILLNIQTSQYFVLDEVGARLWGLLRDGKSLRESYQVLLSEYEVEPGQLEQDVLALLEQLRQNELVEILQA